MKTIEFSVRALLEVKRLEASKGRLRFDRPVFLRKSAVLAAITAERKRA